MSVIENPTVTDEVVVERPRNSKRRRAVAFLGIGALACTGIGLGSNALFTDTEGTQGNAFTAGTLDLTAGQVKTGSVNITNLAPGDVETASYELGNAGSLDLQYQLSSLVLTGTAGLDRDGDGGTDTQAGGQQDELDGAGELLRDAPGGGYLPLDVAVFVDANVNQVLDAGEVVLFQDDDISPELAAGTPIALTDTVGGYIGAAADKHEYAEDVQAAVDASLAENAEPTTISVIASYPVGAGNDTQGASVTLGFSVSAEQVANNEAV